MELVANRMHAQHGPFDIHAWARDVPLLSWATVQAAIVGPDGHLVSTTLDANAKPINLRDREHIRIHLDGRVQGLFVGKPVIGRLSGQTTIQITRRVDSTDGRLLGIIVFSLSPAQLTGLPRSIDLGARGVITLVGFDGVIRARFTRDGPDGLSGIGETVNNGPHRLVSLEDGDGFFVRHSVVDGVRRLYSYHRVADQPLDVIVGLDLDEALVIANSHAVMIASITGAATLLLVVLAAYLICEINRRTANEIRLAGERQKLEDTTIELAASKADAEAANRAKSMFLASMSHELRTPLNAVIGFAQLIKAQDIGKIRTSRDVEYARHIETAGEHLLGIINSILDIIKLESENLKL
ncbi:MAG TPA: histidine kinase dimerization/phospho-acceptor domain-containing protein, partial [Stellaceae bacterium]|nr:histidine kinase dimerization/phospho-acceptor domain-containing protein [Stellaceae bacterium]